MVYFTSSASNAISEREANYLPQWHDGGHSDSQWAPIQERRYIVDLRNGNSSGGRGAAVAMGTGPPRGPAHGTRVVC
ncbi:hypothetical protein JTE90_004699 [Oedothorax gibbosus]|uniref:Uncharacterized protein n=1 Tax=Oedothorax gibbosus TaxID=931172 RepID=A0AAV6UAK0_9ARAC|nr:hypothetical protein JTE90_004699 [Oedothorax gibbosus]